MPARPADDKPSPPPNALTYTLQGAALLSGLSVSTLRRRAAEGKLRLVRCGGRTLAEGASLRCLLNTDAG